MTTRTDYRDAVGWLYAALHRDAENKNALAMVCDPAGLIDALTDMLLGLAAISTDGKPKLYLDHMRDNIDDLLKRAGMEDQ